MKTEGSFENNYSEFVTLSPFFTQCKEYQKLDAYSIGRIFKHSPREIYLRVMQFIMNRYEEKFR